MGRVRKAVRKAKKKAKISVKKILRFFWKVALKARRDELFLKAHALSYSSLLAFIPLTFVSLWIIPARLFLDPLQERIRNLVFSLFLPEAAYKISSYVDEFLKNAQSLELLGLISTIITSIMFLEALDRTFGDIWGVRKRTLWLRFALFWAFITLLPIILGVSIYLNYMIESKITFRFFDWFYMPLPYLAVVLAFTMVYVVFPSADVKFK